MAHHIAAPRVRVDSLPPGFFPEKFFKKNLEENQLIATCCRHPENHEIEAWYSSEQDRDKGIPDIYINYCTCGRMHRRFCVGGGDQRPIWEVR